MVFGSKQSTMVNDGFDPEWLTPQRSPCVLLQHRDVPSGHYGRLARECLQTEKHRVLESQKSELRLIRRKTVHRATVTRQSANS